MRATDTHVLVFVITTARVLEECEIWLAFGQNKNFRYIAADTSAAELVDDLVQGLVVHVHPLRLW